MTKKILPFITVCLLLSGAVSNANSAPPRLGVWITVFSRQQVLHSSQNMQKLVNLCEVLGVTDIYLQVYRSDQAYYDSSITDRGPFENVIRSAGEDLIPHLIKKAGERNIKVHAWINVLSLAHNREANIIKKFGEDVLTFDQIGRPSMGPAASGDELDKRYARENQLFLEPGDWRVRGYIGDIAEEILARYPGLAGLHLDYIRYPATTPYIPGARFTSHGISYGYNRMNLLNFTEHTGIDPQEITSSRSNSMLWDKWRRDQVTRLTSYIAERARKTLPTVEISATVMPSLEKTYFATFQDWTKWLEKGIVDSVIVMNYTDDTRLMGLYSSAIMALDKQNRTQIGIGAYLMKDDTAEVMEQITLLKNLSPSGIVIFSYDDLADNTQLKQFLAENFSKIQ